MTDRGTIKLARDDYERHNERRKEMGLSWPEYIDGQAPESEISGQLDRIEAAAKEATNAAQNAEQAITEATK